MIKPILLLITFSVTIAWAGQEVGKGGDAVRCNEGLYALDYMVFASEDKTAPAAVTSYEQSLFRIRKNLANKLPELLPSFDEYTASIFNNDTTKKYLWEQTPYALVSVDDQDLPVTVKIPESCRVNHKIALVQAVIRQNPSFSGTDHIIFKYMQDVVSEMNSKNPLQLSFLLVHEWLWSHSDNVDRNRRINWLLHSPRLDQLDREDLLKELNALGFNPTTMPIVVDPKGSGTYRNLQEALLNYQGGQTLLLKEGTYNTGGVAILQPVTLVGDGDPAKIIIQGAGQNPALQIESEGVTIRNMTLKRPTVDSSNSLKQAIITIRAHGALIENCIFSEENRRPMISAMVRMEGNSSATFRKNQFIAFADIYIAALFDDSSITLTENTMTQGRLFWNSSHSSTLSKVENNVFGEKFGCWIDQPGPDEVSGKILLSGNTYKNTQCKGD